MNELKERDFYFTNDAGYTWNTPLIYYWNGKPLRPDLGRLAIAYCTLNGLQVDIELRKTDSSQSVYKKYKLEESLDYILAKGSELLEEQDEDVVEE